MSSFSYTLPPACRVAERYPPVDVINPNPPSNNLLGHPISTLGDVVAHYTLSSLKCDGIEIAMGTDGRPSIKAIINPDGSCTIGGTLADSNATIEIPAFAVAHEQFLNDEHGGLAFAPQAELEQLGVWNPMSGYPVNESDGPCKWATFLPLGMGMSRQRAVTLLHYPPYVAMTHADYLHNQTLFRWQMLLRCNGIEQDEAGYYNTFVDVNPIAAPGSGQSEYPNDYLPIMLASFYDQEPSYIRNMLQLLLNPVHNADNPYTLPLLVGGSPTYDPQAPGWFRVRYKDQLPTDANGTPQAVVGQVGTIQLLPSSTKKTPYMIVNHMIAAGVEGLCTSDAASPCDIRMYEAQDLSAATFLKLYGETPAIDPATARAQAFERWFGNATGTGPPKPAASQDALTLCAMAQMDLNFEPQKTDEERFAQALARCKSGGGPTADPCAAGMPRDDKECCCK